METYCWRCGRHGRYTPEWLAHTCQPTVASALVDVLIIGLNPAATPWHVALQLPQPRCRIYTLDITNPPNDAFNLQADFRVAADWEQLQLLYPDKFAAIYFDWSGMKFLRINEAGNHVGLILKTLYVMLKRHGRLYIPDGGIGGFMILPPEQLLTVATCVPRLDADIRAVLTAEYPEPFQLHKQCSFWRRIKGLETLAREQGGFERTVVQDEGDAYDENGVFSAILRHGDYQCEKIHTLMGQLMLLAIKLPT